MSSLKHLHTCLEYLTTLLTVERFIVINDVNLEPNISRPSAVASASPGDRPPLKAGCRKVNRRAPFNVENIDDSESSINVDFDSPVSLAPLTRTTRKPILAVSHSVTPAGSQSSSVATTNREQPTKHKHISHVNQPLTSNTPKGPECQFPVHDLQFSW